MLPGAIVLNIYSDKLDDGTGKGALLSLLANLSLSVASAYQMYNLIKELCAASTQSICKAQYGYLVLLHRSDHPQGLILEMWV